MAQTVSKTTDFDSHSQEFAAKHPLPGSTEEIRKHLADNALKAAKKVTDMMDYVGDPQVARLQFDAAKSTLKYNGYEVERVEHGGEIRTVRVDLPLADGGTNGSY